MATVSITVPTGMVTRTKNAMRATFPEVAGLSDVAAFQEVTAAYWREIIKSYEAQQAADTARTNALNTATTDTAVIV